jgi:hypothetical protein
MDSGQIFVLAIIAISVLGGIGKHWVRARHGYPLEDRQNRRMRKMQGWQAKMSHWGAWNEAYSGDAEGTADARKIELLSSENERLTGQIGRLEERLRVLERIATDPAERTAREIEALRDRN